MTRIVVLERKPGTLRWRWTCERCSCMGVWLSMADADRGGRMHNQARHDDSNRWFGVSDSMLSPKVYA